MSWLILYVRVIIHDSFKDPDQLEYMKVRETNKLDQD